MHASRILMLCLLLVAPTARAAVSSDLKAQLQQHSDVAKAEGKAGMADLAAGHSDTGCAHLRTSKDEIAVVLGLLSQWRDAVMNDTSLTVTQGVAEMEQIDQMTGAWMGTQSQMEGKISAYCAA